MFGVLVRSLFRLSPAKAEEDAGACRGARVRASKLSEVNAERKEGSVACPSHQDSASETNGSTRCAAVDF